MEGEATQLAGAERAAFAATLAAVVGIALAAIFSVDYLPTHDGPQHIYTVHAKQHLDAPGTGYGRFLEAGHPLTAWGFAAVFGPFDRVMSWQAAYRTALAVMVLGWIFGAIVLAHTLGARRVWLGLALASASYSWTLYMGFFSFYIATAFGLWVLAFTVGSPLSSLRSRGILTALLLVQGALHIFPAILTAAVALVVWIAKTAPERRRHTLAAAIACGAPVGLLALAIVLGRDEQTTLLGRSTETWASQWSGIALGAKTLLGGPAWRAYGLGLLALGLAATALLRMRGAMNARDAVLLAAGASAAAAGFLLPLHLIGWDFFSVRFLPLALVALLLAFPLERVSGRSRTALALLCAGIAFSNQLWALDYNRELDRFAAPALRAIDAPLERSGPRLAVVMDPGLDAVVSPEDSVMPFAVPLLNLGQLYATAQGGFPADTFAISPATHQVLIRKDAPPFPPYPDRTFAIALARETAQAQQEARAKFASFAASFGTGFEDIVWFGTAEDHALLEARGFVFDHREGRLAIARFRGCPLSLELDRPPGGASTPGATLGVELGWYPLLEASQHHLLDTSNHSRIDFRGAPCGPVWLRVRDADGLHAGGASCRGADAEGRLVLRDTRDTPTVRCQLEAS